MIRKCSQCFHFLFTKILKLTFPRNHRLAFFALRSQFFKLSGVKVMDFDSFTGFLIAQEGHKFEIIIGHFFDIPTQNSR